MLNELFVPLHPVMPTDFASSAIQQVWPYTQMFTAYINCLCQYSLGSRSLIF